MGGGNKLPEQPEITEEDLRIGRYDTAGPYGGGSWDPSHTKYTEYLSPEAQAYADQAMGIGQQGMGMLDQYFLQGQPDQMGNQDFLNQMIQQYMGGQGGPGAGAGSYGQSWGGGGMDLSGLMGLMRYDSEGNPSIGQALMTDLDLGSLPGFADEGDLMGARDKAEAAMFQRAMGLVDPGFSQRKSQEAEMLANRGIMEGSEIAGIYGGNTDQAYNQARQMAALDAVREGRTEYGFLADEARATRGQTLTERLQQAGLINASQQQMMQANLAGRGQQAQERYQQGQLGLQGQANANQRYSIDRAYEQQGIQNAFNAQSQLWSQQMGEQQDFRGFLSSLLGYGAPGQGLNYSLGQNINTLGAFQQGAANQAQNFQNSPLGIGIGLAGTLGGAALSSMKPWSSETYKHNFEDVDSSEVLEKVNKLDIPRWNYNGEFGPKSIGPMAEQFADEFGTPMIHGNGEITIDAISAIGVALKAIQALTEKVDELEERLGEV